MTLRIEIRHLVVDAPGPVDSRLLEAELRAELARRFADGEPVGGGAVDRMALHLSRTEAPGAGLGTRLAGAVHGAIGQVGGER